MNLKAVFVSGLLDKFSTTRTKKTKKQNEKYLLKVLEFVNTDKNILDFV
jgi:hypothetical protein